MKIRTRDELEILYQRIYDRANEGMGYQPFGIDWPTLRMIRPLLYAALRSVILQLRAPVEELA